MAPVPAGRFSGLQAMLALVDEFVDLPVEGRASWIEQRAGRDPGARDLLERVVQAAAWAERGEWLNELSSSLPDTRHRFAGHVPGDRIGPFILERVIGTGGMGTVWLADYADKRMRRQVALKLPSFLLPARAMPRFEHERQTLSTLEHPNIARLYEAGIDGAGQLFMAMEYVEGEPIDRYCDRHRLSIDQRLHLFLQVIDAVHFAHRALIVHRDLKPANILVASRGDVRLLDFGIAKDIGEGGDADSPTLIDGGAMTPRYAAPEQFEGGRITTATDVFALGVLLHELLTGTMPFATKSALHTAVERAVLEHDPVPPSRAAWSPVVPPTRGSTDRALRARLAGDLDVIVATALRKAPAHRYPSADAMGHDLRHHLRGQPITAMPERRWYRLGKFMRRHRRGLAASALVALSAGGGVFIAAGQYMHAQSQRAQSEAVKGFLSDVLSESEPLESTADTTLTGERLVDAGIAIADRDFADQPQLHGELLVELGRLYQRHGAAGRAGTTIERGVALLAGRAPETDPALNKGRAFLAGIDLAAGRVDEAVARATHAAVACGSIDPECAKARAYAEQVLADIHRLRGEDGPALAAAQRALDAYRAGFGDDDVNVASAWESVALTMRELGRFGEAREALQHAMEIGSRRPLRASHRRRLEQTAAAVDFDLGQYDNARARLSALRQSETSSAGGDMYVPMLLAMTLAYQGRAQAALSEAQEAERRADAAGIVAARYWARQQGARALSLLGRHADAIAEIGAVVSHFEAAAGGTNVTAEVPRRHLGEYLLRAGRVDEAAEVLTRNLAGLRSLYSEDDVQVAQSKDLLGVVARIRGEYLRSAALHSEAAAALAARVAPAHPWRLRNSAYAALTTYLADRTAEHGRQAAQALQRFMDAYPSDSLLRLALQDVHERLVADVASGVTGAAGLIGYPDVVLAH